MEIRRYLNFVTYFAVRLKLNAADVCEIGIKIDRLYYFSSESFKQFLINFACIFEAISQKLIQYFL